MENGGLVYLLVPPLKRELAPADSAYLILARDSPKIDRAEYSVLPACRANPRTSLHFRSLAHPIDLHSCAVCAVEGSHRHLL